MRRPKLPKLRRRARNTTPARAPVRSPAPAMIRPPAPRRRVPRVAVLALAAVVVLVVVVLLVSSCGNDEQQVRDTLQRYAQASRDKDYQTLCDDLLASKLVEQLRDAGRPCEVAFRIGLSNVHNPTLDVLSVDVNGDEALAKVDTSAVGQPPARATIELIHEDDGWRIKALPSVQPTSTAP